MRRRVIAYSTETTTAFVSLESFRTEPATLSATQDTRVSVTAQYGRGVRTSCTSDDKSDDDEEKLKKMVKQHCLI